jgi:deazaflavin-dependent oxidoreductase (nitroreductase family)
MNPTTRSLRRAAGSSDAPLPLAIRVLRRFNPAIGWILRSPLHRLLSANLVLLTYVGAKTGKRRTIPLSYVTVDGRLYLCTRSSVWWRNLRGDRPVAIRLRGRRVAATPAIVDLRSSEALDALRAFLTANPQTGEMLYQVRRGADRRPSEDDLRREVLRSVVVRLDVER